ncbi:hypothetical protein PNIG_a0536 [Pseudoalteromonas nigrifaciens]|jgi:hypothetical protein|uniref:Lipoprotein n=1 Tax=Pseudoalteromonas nigrifaciens TaxID=28109 RepID=A0AAC9UFR6_9GAMM|nr:hypothetical protein [Pseudoalteromonas nigrifaciens]ASM52844.1 hypothetical protein PNIG_a0536 [Pseudoalteromonas nigrifaciens]GEN43950.1 hypothetical protein PNI02_34160 [Pseudoalteromonas nigrifaciens]SUC53282.1 Uncharacterised protein [Pseudoalteromonas nigrifaciens]
MRTALLTTVISLAVLSGCKSTHRYDVLAPNDPIPLTINSTDVYKWDNDDSVPFNLARLGYNSGVGRGVNDSANPQANTVGKSSVGLSAATGFLFGGVLDAVGNGVLASNTNDRRDWRPYIVDFVPVEQLDITKPVDAAYIVQQRLGGYFKEAMAEIDGADFHGAFFQKNKRIPSDNYIVYSGDECVKAYSYMHTENNLIGVKSDFWKKNIVNITDEASSLETGCAVGFTSSVAGVLNGHYIVVHEASVPNMGIYTMLLAAPKLPIATVFPSSLQMSDINTGKKSRVSLPTSFSYVNGVKLYFDSNVKSKPII